MSRTKSEAPITALHIAISIVAAGRLTGVAPDKAFEAGRGHVKTRLIAAAGGIARLGWTRAAAAKAFRVDPIRLAPSNLASARIEVDDLLAIAEAIDAAGLGQGSGGPRFREPWQRIETPAVPSETLARTRLPPKPDLRVVASPAAADKPRLPLGSKPRKPSLPRAIAAAKGPTLAFKPIKPTVLRWAQQQIERGADLAFVAWCFNLRTPHLRSALAEAPAQAVAA